MEKNLTQGSIKKHYFKYLGAAFGSSMISCIYGLVDVAVVGQYQGPQGTAALSIVAPVWTILYSLGILTGSGGSIKYTYYKAQGKTSKANAYFTLSLLLTSVIAVVCWIGLTVFDDQLLRLFGADDILLPLAKTYLRPIQFVIPAYPFTQMLAAYLRNDNAPGVAAFAALCGGCFNIFGDLYFAFGLDMGMFGAGLAMDSCGTFVPECVCESIYVPNRQRIAYCSRYYAGLWSCVSAFTAEHFRNLLFSVCDATENSIDCFYGTRYSSVRYTCVRTSSVIWC